MKEESKGGWMDGWMKNGWMKNGWMKNGWMDGWIDEVEGRDRVSGGVEAQMYTVEIS